jgi:hypothetical protein
LLDRGHLARAYREWERANGFRVVVATAVEGGSTAAMTDLLWRRWKGRKEGGGREEGREGRAASSFRRFSAIRPGLLSRFDRIPIGFKKRTATTTSMPNVKRATL